MMRNNKPNCSLSGGVIRSRVPPVNNTGTLTVFEREPAGQSRLPKLLKPITADKPLGATCFGNETSTN